MDTTDLRNTLRDEVDDAVVPYLVSDALVYTYIDDAQKMFCRQTEGIEDGRRFQLAVVANTEWYAIDKSILKLRKATDTATGRPVDLINPEKAEGLGVRFDGRTGVVRALVIGIEKNFARAWPKPSAAMTVALDVFRLPLTVNLGDELEIDEQHHLSLLLWVKHKFYGNEDSEVSNPNKAAEYEQRFRAYCAAARIEQGRARRTTSSVSYGGI